MQDVLVVGGFCYRPPLILLSVPNHFDFPLAHAWKFSCLDQPRNSFGMRSRVAKDSFDARRLFLLFKRPMDARFKIIDIDKLLI